MAANEAKRPSRRDTNVCDACWSRSPTTTIGRCSDPTSSPSETVDSRFEWWAIGQALVAELLRGEDRPNALIEAREVALQGLEKHPTGVAAAACNHHVKAIESPAFSVEAMASDGVGRRSLRVTHRNIGEVFFRAWRIDLDEVIRPSRDYNLLPGYREVPEYLAQREPVAEWSLELPQTPDFRSHRTDGVPPLYEKGVYLVAASARSDFAAGDNLRMAFNLFISDLVLLSRQIEGRWEITARSGFQGDALGGVELDLLQADWQRGHRRVRTYTTAGDGRAVLDLDDRGHRHFAVGRTGDDLAS